MSLSTDPVYAGVISIDDQEFDTELLNLVKEFGVVIIKNVIPPDECDNYVASIIDEFSKVSDFDPKKNVKKTWKHENLPQQVRPGMFHELVCNTPTINRLRFEKNIIRIFKVYYSALNDVDYKDTDLVVSNDGYSLKPGTVEPFHTDKTKDWAHLDQTDMLNEPYKCIQGQIILTNTSACFRASVKSNQLFNNFMSQKDNPPVKINGFFKFDQLQYKDMAKKLEKIGGHWQVPIRASKGDFIIWASSVVHSAMHQLGPEHPLPDDKWHGWRCVVYICYRPREEFTYKQLGKKYDSVKNNLVTSHWGTKIFPSGLSRYNYNVSYSEKLKKLIKNPKLVYDIPGLELNLTEEQHIMLGRPF